jgi:FkbM family methyltransferase
MQDTGTSFRAQNGEDRWLDTYFQGKREGYFVEVGAYDGVALSNTYHFEQIGWHGVLVEPDPDNAANCMLKRPGSRTFQCAAVATPEIREISFHKVANGGVFSTTSLTDGHAKRIANIGLAAEPMRVPARTLDSMLAEAGASRVDFVSIDVEGGELDVLAGFDIRRWQPRIVVVESNTKTRLPAIRRYFLRNGYAYLHSIDVNDFYERTEGPASVTALLDGFRYGLFRVRRRIRRIAHNLRRAWNKRARRVAP